MTTENPRLVTWNCAGGFHKKAGALQEIVPDIAVLSEVSEDCVSIVGGDASGIWIGSNPGYGLAVLGRNGWIIERTHIKVDERLFLPVTATRGSQQLHLVGVCAKKDGDYVAPTLRALSALSAFISENPAVVVGDFNQSAKFDANRRPAGQFRRVQEVLWGLGLVSAWHQFHDEEFGKETVPTYYHRWKENNGFHIDYAFVSREIEIAAAELGSHEGFVAAGMSDHVPLIVDLVT